MGNILMDKGHTLVWGNCKTDRTTSFHLKKEKKYALLSLHWGLSDSFYVFPNSEL